MLFFPLPESSSDARAIVSDCCAMLGRSASYVAAHVGTYVGTDKAVSRARKAPMRVAGASAALVRAAGSRYGEGVDVSSGQQLCPTLARVVAKRVDFVSSPEDGHELLGVCGGWQEAPVLMWRYLIDWTYPPWSGNRAERKSPATGVDAQKAPPPPPCCGGPWPPWTPRTTPPRPRWGGHTGT